MAREAWLRVILETEPECVKLMAADGSLLDMNPAGLRMVEAESIEQVRGRSVYPLVVEAHRAAVRELTARVFRGESARLEFEIVGLKGGRRWLETHATPLRDAEGRVVALLGITRDVSDRKAAEERLRRSERTFAALFDKAAFAAALWRLADGVILNVNEAWERAFGFGREEAVGRTGLELGLYPPDPDGYRAFLAELEREGRIREREFDLRVKSGERRTFSVNLDVIEVGGERCGLATALDVTERRRTLDALRRSQEQLAALVDSVDGIVWEADAATWRFTFVSPKAERLLGYPVARWTEEPDFWVRHVHPDDRDWAVRFCTSCVAEKRDHEFEYRMIAADGRIVWLHDIVTVVVEGGRPVKLRGLMVDVTERRRAEDALRASEERFRELAETIDDVFWIQDPRAGKLLYVSPGYERVWGRSCRSLYDAPGSWLEAVHPEDRERVARAAAARQAAGLYDEEYRIVRPDGRVRWVRDRAFPVRNAAGEVERIVGVARDITERRQLEEQLRQAQRLEAIGQLAGGVAHDFNNILTSILMEAELAAEADGLPGEVRESLAQIRTAAERAAGLTRQLLLFSRRQVLQPRVLDLNEVVAGVAKLLQRIIGEDIRLQLDLHPGPLWTRADVGTLDQVLMNLAVNARDAMPEGGRLFVETGAEQVGERPRHPEARPGAYVWVRVRDTGVGIPREVLPRIFEPFFTTKEPGKGTGLGLAMVYGVVRQQHGWVEVESEPGRGATFQVFLPAAPALADEAPVGGERRVPGGSETVLLVEDDAAVRQVTRTVLARHGYRVVEAGSGVEALEVWRAHRERVALVVTDLVMPGGVSGHELARRLRAERPGLKVIFMSGYSAAVAEREAGVRDGENFLQKPFPAERLLETVRRCLDA
ncbi:MAG TPA: PAS domain S-box protein [Burkholderiales bacterium]|nr:PAS domain S-box protein [Burkholderiales bacterium]